MIEARARLFDAAWAAEAVGGSILGDPHAPVSSVVVDSRKVEAGALFAALPGEKTDGHAYVSAALRSGAACILARSDRRASLEASLAAPSVGTALVFVPDVLPALQALAAAYRRRFASLVRIGITGSSGKTTTKECVAAILGRSRSVVLNPGNLNSDIGLPLSMFSIEAGHEVGVFEMGMNRAGEMGEIATVYEPDIALITNVGTAHIGILGSRRAIAEEKKRIFSRFDGRQAGFVWEADDYNAFLKEGVRGDVSDFGPKSTAGLRILRDRGLSGYELEWRGRAFRFPLPGSHNLLDAIGALAAAKRAGASDDDVAEGLGAVKPLFGRSEILEGQYTIVRDCYNSNPDSARAAIELCDSISREGRRVYVLGSMLELGAESESAHRALGELAGRSSADALFFFGEESRPAFEAARLAGFRGLAVFETDFDGLKAALRAYIAPGDLALLKASRGMALERLADSLMPGSASADALIPGSASADAHDERRG
jgi:UDP-N-acetylmuramoyl-tripeptide--D-alanyl-D-alanine ligase